MDTQLVKKPLLTLTRLFKTMMSHFSFLLYKPWKILTIVLQCYLFRVHTVLLFLDKERLLDVIHEHLCYIKNIQVYASVR